MSFVSGMRFELGEGTFGRRRVGGVGSGPSREALEMLLPVEGKELQRFAS